VPLITVTVPEEVTTEPAPFVPGGGPSDEDLLDLVTGIGVVGSTVAWELLDRDFNVVTELSPETTASIEVRASETTKRTLSDLSLSPGEAAFVDVHADRLRPSWRLASGSSYPLGVFLFSDVQRRRLSYGEPLRGSLYDQTVLLDQPIERSFPLKKGATGTVIAERIATLLTGVGISRFVLPEIDVSVGTPINWPAGESRYKILSDLFTIADLYPPFFDNRGWLIGKPIPHPLSSAAFDHVYDDRMVRDSIVEIDDSVKAPNRYLVVDTGPTNKPIVAFYDVPASWPHSIGNRGFVVTEKVSVNGLKTAAEAALAAERAAMVDFRAGFFTVEFDAPPDPRHDVFDVVSYRGQNMREAGWRLDLRPGGTHHHSLRGIY
jgi:hypothetical protein